MLGRIAFGRRRTFGAFKQSLSEILDPRLPPLTNPTRHKLKTRSCVRSLNCWVGTTNMPQQGSDRQEDIPDYLLFADEEAKDRAAARQGSENRYQDALVIEESKRFGLPLDNRDQR